MDFLLISRRNIKFHLMCKLKLCSVSIFPKKFNDYIQARELNEYRIGGWSKADSIAGAAL